MKRNFREFWTHTAIPTDDKEAWRDRANCAGTDPYVFENPDFYDQARQICRRCPVLQQCRDWNDKVEAGTPVNYTYLVYAAETPRQRYNRRTNKPRRGLQLGDTCKHGHVMTAQTLYTNPNSGYTYCRQCNSQIQTRKREQESTT